MTFDPRNFLRTKAAGSSTTVKAHGYTVKLTGTADEYTLSSICQLARQQAGTVAVTSPAVELDEGHTIRERFALVGGTAATFLAGGTGPSSNGTSGKGKSKAEQRAAGSIPEAAANGAAS